MASYIVFFFMFLTITTTIHARESQFFAKVSNNIPKQETQQQTLTNTNQQDPTFIPQSQESGPSYGLFGHGSGQLPPSSSTTNTNTDNGLPANLPENYNPVAYTTPIHSSTQDIPEDNQPQTYQVDNNSENQEEYMGNNDDSMYNSEKQGFNDASLMQTENGGNMYNYENNQGFYDASFMQTENGYNNQKQGGSEMYNSEMQRMEGYNGNMYNAGKQGMSDTRFLENGKYFYDVNMERANANSMNSRGVRNGFETQGYNGNYENTQGYNGNYENTQGYNGNYENTYDKYNTNGGYQSTYDKYNTNGGYQNQEEYQMNQYNP